MAKLVEWISNFFNSASPTVEARPGDVPQIGPIPEYLLEADKIQDLTVVISSPLTGLDGIRSGLARFLNGLPGVRCFTFEHAPHDGSSAGVSSREAVQQADLIVVLIGDSLGTTDPVVDKTYSQIEFEETKKLQLEKNGRPRLLVYVQEPLARALQPWEEEVKRRHNSTPWDDPAQLHLIAYRDISALLLAERQKQCKGMRDWYKRELRKAEGLDNDLRRTTEQRDRAEEQLAAATSNHLELQRSAGLALTSQGEQGRAFGWKAAAWSVLCVVIGSLLAIGAGWLRQPAQTQKIEVTSDALIQGATALSRIAAQNESLPSYVQAKATLARKLNSRFECAARTIADWEVEGIRGAWFSRRDACEGHGALRVSVTRDATACEQPIFTADDYRFLVELFKGGEVRVDAIRLLGHSSTENIASSCNNIAAELTACDPNFDLSDLNISNNDKLADARASLAACRLSEAMVAGGTKPLPRILSSGVGTLFAIQSPVDAMRHRRMDIEIYASALVD